MHVDMDAFYAAVEERYSPELRGKPVVVGADPKDGQGRGVVTTANYLARKYGIRSALPISRAWRLAEAARQRGEPAAIFVRGDHRLYSEVSARVMAIVAEGADAFEQESIDEAYVDVSSLSQFEAALERAREIKHAIVEREGLTASIGIGANKLVAKIASDFEKPDGLTLVRPEEVQAFLDPMPIRVIPGVGPKTEALLRSDNIRFVRDLRCADPAHLSSRFGRWGQDILAKAHGISESPIGGEWERKSVGEQETFEQDTLSAEFILDRAGRLAREVFRRVGASGFDSFRTVTITVRFTDFRTLTRSHTPPEPVTTELGLLREMVRLLLPFLDRRQNPRLKPLRLIGVRAERLSRSTT
jgi:DNA polymerase IV (DinB-like DNA polymerase)